MKIDYTQLIEFETAYVVSYNPAVNSWLLLASGPGPAAFNMALDESLLESVSRLGRPVLRFYGWTEPAATFGYFQKYAEVERATHLRPLIRRPTGGGIVPHDADWTYSLVFPPGHEWHSLKAEESYRRVHEWIQSAFAKLNVTTELAPTRTPVTRHSSPRKGLFCRPRKIRRALARKENRRRGATAEQTWPADSRLGAVPMHRDLNRPGRLAKGHA